MKADFQQFRRQIKLSYDRDWLTRVLLGPFLWVRRVLFGNARYHQSKVVDRLSKIFGDAPQVNLPHFRGRFYIGQESDIFRRIALGDSYESYLARSIEAQIDPKRDAVDVGANCGFYTVLLSKLLVGRKIISVEPTENALVLLRRNIELNGVSENVYVFEGVATDRVGTATLNVIEGREEYSTLGAMSHPSVVPSDAICHEVAATTVDQLISLFSISCGFIKIDVEGHELAVLKGARETLLKHRPVVLTELADPLLRANGSSASEVIDFMKSCDYEVRDPRNPRKMPGAELYGDLLCIPR